MISMAIKYIVVPEKKMVVAILENTKFDAYNKARKYCRELTESCKMLYLVPDPDKMMMPNVFKAKVICDDEDVFDVEVGKEKAKARCLDNYYTSLDKRLNKFKEDLGCIAARINTLPYNEYED